MSKEPWTSQDEYHIRKLLSERRLRSARKNLIPYVQSTFPKYKVAKHLVEIASHLEAVERGEIDRLIIVEPPRHGKSQLVSMRFPVWYLGRNPKSQIIHCAYGGDLATDFGRELRNLMGRIEHCETFPNLRLSPDSKAKDLWHTEDGGVYVAAGVGGPITGRGADLLLIDDPVKSREEADSELMRNKTWNWYTNDAYTRLMPDSSIIVISTRWHEDDLVGRLLRAQNEGGDSWTVLHHPAINAAGEALWPEQFPLKELERRRRVLTMTQGARAWQSLYQGDPTPDEGVYFERSWLRRGVPPEYASMKYYGASDYAVTADGGDYTVHGVIGIDRIERMWLVDLWRKQTSSDKWIPPLLDMMQKWKPIRWAEEGGQIDKAVGPFLLREQMRRKIYTQRVQFTSSRDKPSRARSIQGRIAMRGLWLPYAAPWSDTVESELLKFPTGTYDDIVDFLSLIGRMIAGLEAGTEQATPAQPLAEGQMTLNKLIELEERRERY